MTDWIQHKPGKLRKQLLLYICLIVDCWINFTYSVSLFVWGHKWHTVCKLHILVLSSYHGADVCQCRCSGTPRCIWIPQPPASPAAASLSLPADGYYFSEKSLREETEDSDIIMSNSSGVFHKRWDHLFFSFTILPLAMKINTWIAQPTSLLFYISFFLLFCCCCPHIHWFCLLFNSITEEFRVEAFI